MDTLIMHFMILTTSIPSFIILMILLKRTLKSFLVFMFIGALLLLGHIMLFSITRIIFNVFSIDANIGFFNWWSLFIRLQVPVTFLGIGILALLDDRNE